MSTNLQDQPIATASQMAGAPDDEAAIRAPYREILDAWGRGDGQAYAARFTEDADYVSGRDTLPPGDSAGAGRLGWRHIF